MTHLHPVVAYAFQHVLSTQCVTPPLTAATGRRDTLEQTAGAPQATGAAPPAATEGTAPSVVSPGARMPQPQLPEANGTAPGSSGRRSTRSADLRRGGPGRTVAADRARRHMRPAVAVTMPGNARNDAADAANASHGAACQGAATKTAGLDRPSAASVAEPLSIHAAASELAAIRAAPTAAPPVASVRDLRVRARTTMPDGLPQAAGEDVPAGEER